MLEMRSVLKDMTDRFGHKSRRALDRLEEGSEAVLVEVDGDTGLRRRLMELGMLPGTVVRLVRRLEAVGVLELEVRRCRLSLRLADARHLIAHPAA